MAATSTSALAAAGLINAFGTILAAPRRPMRKRLIEDRGE
jgi:hypothetical protein